VPDDGLCEPKHVAQCYMTECCVRRFVCVCVCVSVR